jgi:hypothetical protein
MKSFLHYITEDDIVLSKAKTRSQAIPAYARYEGPVDPERLETKYDHVKTFRHGGKQYKLLSTRGEDIGDKVFRLAHVGNDESLTDVGTIGVMLSPKKELAHDRIQTQLNRKPQAISLEPTLHPEHAGSGLMSKIYRTIAQHHGVDIISDNTQTRGSQKVWNELADTGRVRAVHAHGAFEPFSYDASNEEHVDKIYRGGENALLHYTHD